MTRDRHVVTLMVVATLLLGCGDDTTSVSSTTSTEITTTTTVTDGPDERLLGLGDVGSGWQMGPGVNDADFRDSTQLPCDDMALNPIIAARLTPVTGIQFEPTDGSSKHLIEFLITGDEPRLAADLQAYLEAMGACEAATPATTGAGTLTVTTLTLAPLGDQRGAFVLTADVSPDATWHVRTATVRVGPVATRVALTEILPTADAPPAVSDADFVQLVEAAVARLDR